MMILRCTIRFLAVLLLMPATVAFAASPCEKGMQLFEGVCLSDRMVAYLKCLDRSGNARLRVVQDEKTAKPSNLTLEVAGAADGKLVKGSGRVVVDRRADEQAIRRLDQAISPNALTACLRASDSGSSAQRTKATARAETAASTSSPPPKTDSNPRPPANPGGARVTHGEVIGFRQNSPEFEDSIKANGQIRRVAGDLKGLAEGSLAILGTAIEPRDSPAAKALANRRLAAVRDLLVAAGVSPKNLALEFRDDTTTGMVLVDGVTINWTSPE